MAKKSKRKTKREVLKSITSHPLIKNIVEFGCGNQSTPYIRHMLKNKGFGFCLSLEESNLYHDGIKLKCPDDQFGRIQLTKCIYDKKGLHYDYKLSEKYDFIYIDGPGYAFIPNPETGILESPRDKIINHISKQKVWLNPTCPKGAKGSIFMMDYALPHMGDNGIIMVDSRKGAVIHYYQKYFKDFVFLNLGDEVSEKTFCRMVKPQYVEKIKFRPSSLTLIYKKGSKTAKKIIKESDVVNIAKKIRKGIL